MSLFISIIRADYLQRTRSYVFLITLIISILVAYTFVPVHDANYTTVRIGNYIGENNSSWIGHVTAIMASTFLWLIGFYLVNNSIRRDEETGVGQIIATTSISNFGYLFAKAVSNFLVLLTITLIIMVMALSLVFIRGGDFTFNAIQFFFPYLLTTIPSIFFLAVVAIILEIIFGNKTNLMNIVFFFLFSFMIIGLNQYKNSMVQWFDVSGVKYLTDSMLEIVNTKYNQTSENVSVGFVYGDIIKRNYFLFEGTNWSALYLASRLVWIGFAILLLRIASKFFNRFDTKTTVDFRKKQNIILDYTKQRSIKAIHVSKLPKASLDFGILPLVKTEFLMLLRKGPWWFWFINLGLIITLFFIPLTIAHQIVLPLLWFLQINRWADIATKEKYYRTHYFAYAAYKPLQRLLQAQIIAGFILAFILALPIILRALVTGDFLSILSLTLGALLVVSFSVFSGIISGGKRLYEILFFMITYGNLNSVPFLDYFGGFHKSITYILLLFGITVLMLSVAFSVRKYEIEHQ
ncbi:MAG: hypothetical protein EHM93_06140 [Bacteroidales bacterium]|nr:MAG: hypothetical protein EHM93_06140 [Bacteroidales bacterium]